MNLTLVSLSPEYRTQLTDMMDEWTSLESGFSPYVIRKNDHRDFDRYLRELDLVTDPERSPNSTFFCLDEDRNIFVGALSIRHRLTPYNALSGGHIGYGVRPSERRKGVATEMLKLALPICREMGLNKILLTCAVDNIGSEKTMRNNGGVFEMEVNDDGEQEKRFWITLSEEEILTERLVLRRELPGDYREAYAWSGDPEVYTYLLSSPVAKMEDMIPWLCQNDPNSRERQVYILRSREDGRAIGTVAAFFDAETDIWSLAYNLRRDEWGRGYTTEAARGLIDHLRQKYVAKHFEIEAGEENLGSLRVAEKLGFSFDHEASYTKKDGSRTFRSRVYRLDD